MASKTSLFSRISQIESDPRLEQLKFSVIFHPICIQCVESPLEACFCFVHSGDFSNGIRYSLTNLLIIHSEVFSLLVCLDLILGTEATLSL